MKAEELTKKREEAERKARRGEIDPTHEFTFHLIGQVVVMRMIMMIVMMIDPTHEFTLNLIRQVHTWLVDYDVDGNDSDDDEK